MFVGVTLQLLVPAVEEAGALDIELAIFGVQVAERDAVALAVPGARIAFFGDDLGEGFFGMVPR
jgi:hypothetical protein